MQRRTTQRGFSLIELMVAMTITLIISGAIYGLLSSGQSAFRREPALVDRQQNIRIAMDLIVRDIQNAGAGMTAVPANLPQIFTNGLNNPGAGSVVSEISPGERADFLELMANDGTCPTLTMCPIPPAPGVNIFTSEPLPACFTAREGPFFVGGPAGPGGGVLHPGLVWPKVDLGAGGCGLGHLNYPPGDAPAFNPPGGACGTPGTCTSVSRVQFVRYEIAPETPGTLVNIITNPPSLWRSDYGRFNYDATPNNGPTDPTVANNPWQLVARGIDDMQIQYSLTSCAAPGLWCDLPGAVVAGDLTTVVQQVRITLSARALGPLLGGETIYAPGGTPGRRGQLTTTVTPRSALITLAAGPAPVQWR